MKELLNVKLIVSEIDGIITDYNFVEDEIGNVLYKKFNTADLDAINELKKVYTFVFMSSDNRINYNFCRRRNIPFYWARNEEEKYNTLVQIMHRYNCTPDSTLYIGSKISDRKCLRMIPLSVVPSNAGGYLRSLVPTVFENKSGHGIILELLDLLRPYIEERERSV